MNDRENSSLNDRIAASTPARPYPSSRRVHGRWEDRHKFMPPGGRWDDGTPAAEGILFAPLEQVKRDDRRTLAIVAFIVALLIALMLLWPFGLDFTDHTCKTRPQPTFTDRLAGQSYNLCP